MADLKEGRWVEWDTGWSYELPGHLPGIPEEGIHLGVVYEQEGAYIAEAYPGASVPAAGNVVDGKVRILDASDGVDSKEKAQEAVLDWWVEHKQQQSRLLLDRHIRNEG